MATLAAAMKIAICDLQFAMEERLFAHSRGSPPLTIPANHKSKIANPPMAEYTKYQQKIIKNYYEHKDAIALQKLSEHVTELYLAEGKARERRWGHIVSVLKKLGLPDSRIEHLRSKDDPALLAKLVEELMGKK
jgi:hypothetical protein